MTRCVGECIDESALGFDETYWDHNAAQPVLLIDDATEAITEALYHLRTGSVLADRDLTAAGVALDDLFGGRDVMTDLSNQLQGMQPTTWSAQQAADGLGRGPALPRRPPAMSTGPNLECASVMQVAAAHDDWASRVAHHRLADRTEK
jgi:hypothetical protein